MDGHTGQGNRLKTQCLRIPLSGGKDITNQT